MRLELRAARDVELHDGRFFATSTEPWLTLENWPRRWAWRLVEITYRLSLLDEPVRPVLRFCKRDGTSIHRIAPAPVLGAGIWIGRLPFGTIAIEISPTNRGGPFDFRIERMRPRLWLPQILRGFRSVPRSARSAVLTPLIGWFEESDVNLAWAIGATPLAEFSAWAGPRTRAFDPDGMDRARRDAGAVEAVRIGEGIASPSPLWGRDGGGGRASLSPTILEDHAGQREPPPLTPPHKGEGESIGTTEQDDLRAEVILGANDRLLPGALAYVAEQAARHPKVKLFYGDALHLADHCAFPSFRPGWSRRLDDAQPLLRPPLVVRGLRTWGEADQTALLADGRLPADWLASLADDEIRPLRRLLVETSEPVPAPAPLVQGVAGQPARATIIIPTRDHPALLRRVITSIRARTAPGRYEIIIVDNASITAEARATLADLAEQPDVEVVAYPGAFNFSAICNAGAAKADGDVLVFLNDDTEVLSDGWLDRLTALAMASDVGAVGPKLTYPDGRIQHIGILAGMGESAGHFGALDPADAPGWAGRNLAIHDVSAVTGACLAVARQKFEAVGRFDAIHLPIELSDIDLCFKLNARGWQTLLDPGVHLMHEESVSRGGATFRRVSVHAKERTIFQERWRHILRDDPFFHPALSLYSCRAALG